MDDALYHWKREVQNSDREAESLTYEIDAVRHALDDLTHTIRDLGGCQFRDEQEYSIRHSAQQLWDSVSQGTHGIRRQLDSARAAINDLRRVVDFYSHR